LEFDMTMYKYRFTPLIASAVLAVIVGSVGLAVTTDDSVPTVMPEMPTPQDEHKWLERFVGEWTSEAECEMPGQESMKCQGTQTARMLGGFWMLAEGSAEMMGTTVRTLLTLGYDPAKQHYVGTWVDSCHNHLWQYKGTLDETGDVLTLETEGPNMMLDGKMTKYREIIDFKGDDHYVFTSSMQGEDGQWQTFMTSNFRRVE
jgi:hypothetical protein